MSNNLILGYFDDYERAGDAIEAIRLEGIPTDHISVYGRNFNEMRATTAHMVIKSEKDRFILRMILGGLILGIIAGLFDAFRPDWNIGHIIMAAFSAGVAGSVLGLVVGVFLHFDRPMYSGVVDEMPLDVGNVMLAVQADAPEELQHAEQIMDRFGAIEVDRRAA